MEEDGKRSAAEFVRIYAQPRDRENGGRGPEAGAMGGKEHMEYFQ